MSEPWDWIPEPCSDCGEYYCQCEEDNEDYPVSEEDEFDESLSQRTR